VDKFVVNRVRGTMHLPPYVDLNGGIDWDELATSQSEPQAQAEDSNREAVPKH
jgi:hypothetical protein